MIIGIAFALLCLGLFSIVRVAEDSEALILRSDEVQRKLGPGLHLRFPFLDKAVIEPVRRQQKFTFETPFIIQECQSEISLIYRISDLEAYYARGGSQTPLNDMRHDLQVALDFLPDLSELADATLPYADQIADHLQPFSGPVTGGLYITRASVDLEQGCEPKRIVQQETLTLTDINSDSALAPERTASGSLRATTLDGVELQIDDFVATYAIEDAAQVEACFGQNYDMISVRIENIAARFLKDAIQQVSLNRLSEIPAKLNAALKDDDLATCGLVMGAVDFSQVKITRRTVVNCEKTPVDDCFPSSITRLHDLVPSRR